MRRLELREQFVLQHLGRWSDSGREVNSMLCPVFPSAIQSTSVIVDHRAILMAFLPVRAFNNLEGKMASSANDWKNRTWGLHPQLEMPHLRPCVVQCAIFETDPRIGFIDRARLLKQNAKVEPSDGVSISNRELLLSLRAAAWNKGFKSVSGDDVFLLKDFRPIPEKLDPDSGRKWVEMTQMESLFISSNGTEGKKWLATAVLHYDGGSCYWCIPFEAKKGETTQIKLTKENAIDLEEENL